MRCLVYSLAIILSLSAGAAVAQERAAGSNIETQMTWTALSNMVNDANARSAGVAQKITQVEKCNLKYKLYAPAGTAPDADGCVVDQPVADLNTRVGDNTYDISQGIKCAKLGQLYTGGASCGKAVVDNKAFSKEILESKGWISKSYTLKCTEGRTVMLARGNGTTNPNQAPCSIAAGRGCDHERMDCFGKSSCGWEQDGRNYYSMLVVCTP